MMDEKPVKVQIKGIRDGLLVTLGEGDWSELQQALLDHVQERSGFFQGARLAIDVGNTDLHAADLGGLRDRLSEQGITLWAVLSNSESSQQTAQALGLATRIAAPARANGAVRAAAVDAPPIASAPQSGANAILVQKTLRSGMRIAFPGHVAVIGDINPGAEIVAGGSVVVWGRLRGMVHAGAEGDETAQVCALDVNPTQLRIAGHIAVTPKRKGKVLPEIVRIIEGQVVAEPWDMKAEGGR